MVRADALGSVVELYSDLRLSTNDRSKWTVFAVAVARDDVHEVQALLQRTDDRELLLNGSDSGEGGTVLHLAAVRNAGDVLSLLTGQEGVDVNRTDDSGKSCLYVAVEYGNVEATRALIESPAGVDVNLPHMNCTPLRKAIRNRSVPLTRMLVDVAK